MTFLKLLSRLPTIVNTAILLYVSGVLGHRLSRCAVCTAQTRPAALKTVMSPTQRTRRTIFECPHRVALCRSVASVKSSSKSMQGKIPSEMTRISKCVDYLIIFVIVYEMAPVAVFKRICLLSALIIWTSCFYLNQFVMPYTMLCVTPSFICCSNSFSKTPSLFG